MTEPANTPATTAALHARLKKALELQLAGKLPAAEKYYLEILEQSPKQVDALHLLGLIRAEADKNDEAIRLIESAIAINCNVAAFHHNIAGIYRRVGRVVDAEVAFRRAIELKPDYGEAFQGLAEMVRFEPEDQFIQQVEDQLARDALDAPQRSYFHFAAGKYFDDVRQYKTAFEHYARGNRLAGRKFSSKSFQQQAKDILYTFSPQLAARLQNFGYSDAAPIFVLGMPRSGTSLAEQILASHSGVHGGGELNEMKLTAREAARLAGNKPYPACMPHLKGTEVESLGRYYMEQAGKVAGVPDHQRLVDKHPLNFLFVGLILAMLPDARIVHTVRHPLDTCLSCYFQNFTRGQDYSFSLPDLASFFNDYSRLMQHWKQLYPGRIYDLHYEALLSNQEVQTRNLLGFCDLEFEEACIGFHRTERAVKTASFLQVRQPIYQTSKNRWRHYTAELREFAALIGVAVDEPVTISALAGLQS